MNAQARHLASKRSCDSGNMLHAGRGATVILGARNLEAANKVAEEIRWDEAPEEGLSTAVSYQNRASACVVAATVAKHPLV